MPGVDDFIILRQYYDEADMRNWQSGDRFRSLVDETWWSGKVVSHVPLDPSYPDSLFLCLKVE